MPNVRSLPPSWGITLIRLSAGLIICVAGLEKLFGGGFEGFTRTSTNLGLPLPGLWGVFIPLLEAIGGLLILAGFGARYVALLFVVEYFVTTFLLKVPRPAPFGGWDSMRIDIMLWVSAITVALVGPGALAVESLLQRRAPARMTRRAAPG